MDVVDWLLVAACTRMLAVAIVDAFWPEIRTGKGPPTDGE